MDGGEQQSPPEAADPDAPAEPAPGVASPTASPPLSVVRAHTYIGQFGTFSKPVVLKCDDGHIYVVKGRQDGRPQVSRVMITDHIVGRLAKALGAPVPEVKLVEVPAELRGAQPQLQHMMTGVAHGSRNVADATERAVIQHTDVPENRPRFALLAILFGWAHASDHQFIYEKSPPHRVYSVDHGHFLPNGPDWTTESLKNATAAQADASLTQAVGLTEAELKEATARLAQVESQVIVEAVASVPEEWGITAEERVRLVEFFGKRREELIARYAPPANQERRQS